MHLFHTELRLLIVNYKDKIFLTHSEQGKELVKEKRYSSPEGEKSAEIFCFHKDLFKQISLIRIV